MPPRAWTSTLYFYPRPPRGGRHYVLLPVNVQFAISIHALREEGDERWAERYSSLRNFYPRPPRGGRPRNDKHSCRKHSISIHALREEGDKCRGEMQPGGLISIHALREEGDETCADGQPRPSPYFYPRPPRGGRLCWRSAAVPPLMISIHALREEGDDAGPARLIDLLGISIHALREEGDRRHRPARRLQYDFYPRPPRGGRRILYYVCATD